MTDAARRLLLLLLPLLLTACGERGLTPLTATPVAGTMPPPDSVLLEPPGAQLVAPFVLDGGVLRLPQGSASTSGAGRATLAARLPTSGAWTLWLHAKWDDSCGNSLGVELPGQPPLIAGEDAVYGSWHWVRVGRFDLAAGALPLVLTEREDGVAVDQALLVQDDAYQPAARYGATALPEPRRFADDFNRSPGHGLAPWEKVSGEWDIAFSFDPNRIPEQYALTGKAGEDVPAELRLGQPPWRGLRISFAVLPSADSICGLRFAPQEGPPVDVLFDTATQTLRLPLGDEKLFETHRAGQWHRYEVELWHQTMVVRNRPLYPAGIRRTSALLRGPHRLSLLVTAGQATFDDVQVEELLWAADRPGQAELSWQPAPGARWRRGDATAAAALVGRNGPLQFSGNGLPLDWLEFAMQGTPFGSRVTTMGGTPLAPTTVPGILNPDGDTQAITFLPPPGTTGFSLEPLPGARPRFGEVVVRYANPAPPAFVVGPYTFSDRHLVDPGDYHDFTPEEVAAMTKENADKNRREPRLFPVVGRGEDKVAWEIEAGKWQVTEGVLATPGGGAVLRHGQPIGVRYRFSGRLRLAAADAVAAVTAYADPGAGTTVHFGAATAQPPPTVAVPGGRQWHAFAMEFQRDALLVTLNGGSPLSLPWTPGLGETLRLAVPAGAVEFDDLQFAIPADQRDQSLTTFTTRATDWWRLGERWIDHAGIACVITSNWVSLVAPESSALLLGKVPAPANAVVAVSVEEYSEWHGWRQAESHEHHAFDNLVLAQGVGADGTGGYRFKVNVDRRYTQLWREDRMVAQVEQDARFPIRYRGGHAPYSPRRVRLALVRQGAQVTGYVNQQPVIQFADPQPLAEGRVAIGGERTRANFTHLEVRALP